MEYSIMTFLKNNGIMMRELFCAMLLLLSGSFSSQAFASQVTDVVIRQTPERLLAKQQVLQYVASETASWESQRHGRTDVVQSLKVFFNHLATVVVKMASVASVLLFFVLALQVQTYYKNPRAVMPAQLGITAMCAVLLLMVGLVPQGKMPSYVPVERTITGQQ